MKNIPESLKKYCGRDPLIENIIQKIGFELSMLGTNYCYDNKTADWDSKVNQILYHEETIAYIYSDFSLTNTNYISGKRPILENLVDMICSNKKSDLDKVLAIVDYVYRGYKENNVDIFPNKNLAILNAMEEEILKLGKVSCECHSRLIICLCQIAGLPARLVSNYSCIDPTDDFKMKGGHTMVEVYIDGKWSLFDSDHGFFCVLDNKRIANLHEILSNPKLVSNQPEWVYHYYNKNKKWYLSFHKYYLSEYSVMSYSNYSIHDYLKYDWNWILFEDDGELFLKIINARETLRSKLLEEYKSNLDMTFNTSPN